jgi:hypothetical protein
VEGGFGLLADVGAGDVEGGSGGFFAMAVGFAVFLEPALAAIEEGVELGGVHLPGEVGVAADGDDAAERFALFDDDAPGGGIEFEDAVPGVIGGIPVGFDEGGDGAEGALGVGDVGEEEEFIGVAGEVEEGLDFDLVLDDFVDVVGDDVGEFLAFFPEPGVVLGEGAAGGLVVGGPVEVAGDGDWLLEGPLSPPARVVAEVEVEVGEEVVAEAVGTADGRTFFGPAFAFAGFVLDFSRGGGGEEFVAEFVELDHAGSI